MMVFDKFKSIDTFILDVDGVLTTGKVWAEDQGTFTRDFNIKDGFALQYAVKQGYRIIIISGGDSEGVRNRLKTLGIQEVHTAISNKKKHLELLSQRLSLDLDNALYMGDDYPDISPMKLCGIKAAPKDAAWEVQVEADIITKAAGGQGAVREVIEKVLILQDRWENTENAVW